MVDLHTHILPAMDDGSSDVETSLAMLRREYEQGVRVVVLSPHFYREDERPKRFLSRRNEAHLRLMEGISALSPEEQRRLPKLKLAAEVAWAPNLSEWEELPSFCIEGTRNLLLELPYRPWSGALFDRIYDLMGRTGITPIIVHIERYPDIQKPAIPDLFRSLNVPVQVNAAPFLSFRSRRTMLRLVRDRRVHVMASDCHNLTSRGPNLKDGLDVLEKKCGKDTLRQFLKNAEALVDS